MNKKGINVLLIEDNPDDARLIEKLLSISGGTEIEVECASCLTAGIDRLVIDDVSLILLDLWLPESQGFETLDIVRSQAPETPIVVLTAFEDENSGIKSLQKGAQDYLVKGKLDGNLLVRVIHYSIERQKILKRLQHQILDGERIREDLRRSEEKYRSIFENIQDIYYEVDFAGRILLLSPSVERISKYKREELIGKSLYEIYSNPEDRKNLLREIKKNGYVYDYEILLKDKNDTPVPCSVTSKVVLDKKGKPLKIIGTMRDITERKRMDEELKASRAGFSNIVEKNMDGIVVLDRDKRVRFANPAAESFFRWKTDEISGTLIRYPFNVYEAKELPIIRPNGEAGIAEMRFTKTQWDGKDAHLAQLRDITERKQAEENLRRYKYMVESANDAIFFKNLKGQYVIANARTFEAFGLPSEEVIGKNDYQLMPDEEEARKNTEDDQVVFKTGKPKDVIKQMTGADGKEHWFQAIKAPQFNEEGSIIGLVGIARDITGIKQTEAKLHLLSSVIEQTAEAVVITDLDGSIQYVNPEFEKITGYSAEEALGKNPRILKSGKHNEQFYQELWDTISGGRIWKGRFSNKKKDGTLYQEDAIIFPVLDSTGRITNYAKAAYDATERIRLENQFLQAQKMEAIGRLAGGIAHDFNNLLTGIIGGAQLAQMELSKNDPVLEYIVDIEKASDSAAELIQQLLAFSRKQIVSLSVVDLNDIIVNMSRMIQRVIGENIEFSMVLDSDINSIKADPTQIEQIIMNLAVNARDAIPKRGTLSIKTTMIEFGGEFRKEFPFTIPGNYVVLEISDTGAGIDSETLSHIFEPFFTTKEKGKGTGLGLSTIYGIVKQLDGYIMVDSELGVGTSFKIYLRPTMEDEAIRLQRKPIPIQEKLSGSETILVVEDDWLIRKVIWQVLEKMGYEMLFAERGKEALLLCEGMEKKPDLLITDIVLPDVNGRELAIQLNEKFPGIKTLFMSGYSEEIAGPESILDEKVDFLGKPFSPDKLLRKIREILDR
ncbi:MAG: PAS domain S-box protein [Candidatus Eremiobacteraeota bacterium]|nr:PAS domain S-box protein [Candidatus Eremiobacteraeota bacterium]